MTQPPYIRATVTCRDAYVAAGADQETTRKMLMALVEVEGDLMEIGDMLRPDTTAQLAYNLGRLTKSALEAMEHLNAIANQIKEAKANAPT